VVTNNFTKAIIAAQLGHGIIANLHLQALYRIFSCKPTVSFETHVYLEQDQLNFDYRYSISSLPGIWGCKNT
jgi:hypothetical protein